MLLFQNILHETHESIKSSKLDKVQVYKLIIDYSTICIQIKNLKEAEYLEIPKIYDIQVTQMDYPFIFLVKKIIEKCLWLQFVCLYSRLNRL